MKNNKFLKGLTALALTAGATFGAINLQQESAKDLYIKELETKLSNHKETINILEQKLEKFEGLKINEEEARRIAKRDGYIIEFLTISKIEKYEGRFKNYYFYTVYAINEQGQEVCILDDFSEFWTAINPNYLQIGQKVAAVYDVSEDFTYSEIILIY